MAKKVCIDDNWHIVLLSLLNYKCVSHSWAAHKQWTVAITVNDIQQAEGSLFTFKIMCCYVYLYLPVPANCSFSGNITPAKERDESILC